MSDWQDEYDDAIFKKGRIAGLREAAEIVKPPQTIGNYTAWGHDLRNQMAQQILARIAELEQKS